MEIITRDLTTILLIAFACIPITAWIVLLILALCDAAKRGDERMYQRFRHYEPKEKSR